METHRLKLTSSAHDHGRISIRPCSKDFFPADAFGGTSINDRMGKLLRLHVTGLYPDVETDLPTDNAGRPRWFFRRRNWVRKFLQTHNLNAGDEITITRLSEYEYRISPVLHDITFIDLFAGIGGTRLGFEAAGARCVFSSEWDKFAQKTYMENFGEVPHGDIHEVKSEDIPNHDILVAGFPCQPFSIAGGILKSL